VTHALAPNCPDYPFKRRSRVTTRMDENRLLDRNCTDLLVYHWQPGDDFGGPHYPGVAISATVRA
jgi:hypothetical protein